MKGDENPESLSPVTFSFSKAVMVFLFGVFPRKLESVREVSVTTKFEKDCHDVWVPAVHILKRIKSEQKRNFQHSASCHGVWHFASNWKTQ